MKIILIGLNDMAEKGNYVPGMGNPNAKIVIVGEAPGFEEDKYKRPFIGPSGDMLDEMLKAAGISRGEVWVTNVLKYRPPFNIFNRAHEIGVDIHESTKELFREIQSIGPNVCIALGDKALTALTGKTGITKYRGSILPSLNGICKVIPTFHPANLVRNSQSEVDEDTGKGKGLFKYAYKFVMVEDFIKAKNDSTFRELRLPDRILKIARNDLDVYRFFERYKNATKCSIDIESMRCWPMCVGFAFNEYEAISIPLYRSLKMGRKPSKKSTARYDTVELANYTDSAKLKIWRMIDELLRNPKLEVIGQNFKFDQDKLQMLGFRFGRRIFADTMLLAHTINPEMPSKRQEFLASIFTREPYYKDEYREFNPRKDSIDRIFSYNAKDCAVAYEIWQREDEELDYLSDTYKIYLRNFFYNYVMKLHPLYLEIENNGFHIDRGVRDLLLHKYERWHEEIQCRFEERLGHRVNTGSPKQMKQLFQELAIDKFYKKGGAGEDVIVKIMNNKIKDDARKAILRDVLYDRRIKKTRDTYIKAELDYDGKMRTACRIVGPETGRSATGILKPPLRPTKMGVAFQTITKHGDIGADVRYMYIPAPNHVFVQADLSQAEARVVSVLSEDYDLLSAFDRIDIHRRTAGLVFDYTNTLELSDKCSVRAVDEIGKDDPLRFIGKKVRHAGNYDMTAPRFLIEVHNDAEKFGIDISISGWKSQQIIDKFHAASPKIRGVFHRDIQQVASDTRVLINPFGRFRMFFGRYGRDLFKEMYAHIPQSTVHDRLTQSLIAMKEEMPDLRVLGEAHDALLFEIPINEVEDRCARIRYHMEQPIDFSNCTLKRDIKLVIPADFEVGENLKQLDKYSKWLEKRAA